MTELGFYPNAINKNIAPGVNDPTIVPVGVVLHVAVFEGPSLRNIFLNRDGIESHFYIRYDGTVEQYRSIYFEADAQTQGNSFMYDGKRCGLISIETEGFGQGKWTVSQLSSIRGLITWVHNVSPYQWRNVCTSWNSPGIGYHSMFSQWNPAHKSCPGPERILQFKNNLAPWWEGSGMDHLNKVGQARRDIISRCRRALDEIPTKRVFARARIRATLLVAKTIPKS